MIFTACVISACSSGPVLEPPAAEYPDSPGFSGNWRRIADNERDNMPQRRIPVVLSRDEARREAANNKTPGSLVRAFLERADNLKITELESALLISFDRSIVEEYRYGELKRINIGPVVAERSSGWQGDTLVIRTLDDDKAVMEERWSVGEQGRLIREVMIDRRGKELYFLEEVYALTSR